MAYREKDNIDERIVYFIIGPDKEAKRCTASRSEAEIRKIYTDSLEPKIIDFVKARKEALAKLNALDKHVLGLNDE